MAVTAGTQGASGTAATTFTTTVANLMTGATPGWIETTDSPVASGIGTTGNVRVFRNSTSTISGTLITGVIILIEAVDITSATAFPSGADANGMAIRIRVAEQYDTATHKVTYAAPGINAVGQSNTVNNNGALSDVAQAIFQAPAAASTVGWCHIRTPTAGFNYWIGAEPLRILVSTNPTGTALQMCIAGRLETMVAGGDSHTVHLTGSVDNTLSSLSGLGSGTLGGFGAYVSREPRITGAVLGAFMGQPHGHTDSLNVTVDAFPIATLNSTAHVYHSVFVAHPMYLHGHTTNAGGTIQYRTNLSGYRAFYNGFIVALSTADPIAGNTITVGGAAYIIVGGSIGNSTRIVYAVHPTSVF